MTIEAGSYAARATDYIFDVTKNGTKFIRVTFLLETGESCDWSGWWTKKSAQYTIDGLLATGWDGENLSEMRGFGELQCRVQVENEDYNGRTYTKVTRVSPLVASGSLGADDLESLNSRIAGIVAERKVALQHDLDASREKSTAPSENGSNGSADAFEAEDLPF